MSKKKLTPGEHISAQLMWFGWVDVQRKDFAAKIINAAIRRAQAEAWDACCDWSSAPGNKEANPYRAKRKAKP